jgi:HEAT repeat protein
LIDIFARASLERKREIPENLMLISEPTAGLLERLLSDPDHHVRGDAAQAAAFFGIGEMTPRIEMLARKGYRDTRQKALRSLCVLDPRTAQALAEEFVKSGSAEDQRIYLSAAELMDKELTYRLVQELLRSKKSKVAPEAVRILGKLAEQDPRFLDMTGELLSRKMVLPEVLEIIKKYRLTALQPKLLKLQRRLRNDPWLRYQTLSALSALGDQGLFDLFAAGLQDRHNLIKIGCIKALVRLGQPRASELISPFLASTDPDLRHAARTAVDTLMTGNNCSTYAGTN